MKPRTLIPVAAMLFAAATFTTQSQAQNTNIWNFNSTGSIVDWTAPSTGYYHITAYGAQGGGDLWYYNSGGLGAIMGGVFQLQAGSVLKLLVGEQGSFANEFMAGGGGGGSFVVGSNNTPLVVAGSGAGVAWGYGYKVGYYGQYTDQSYFSQNANTNTSGGSVGFSHDTSTNVIMTSGGINGNGGNITTSGYGSGDNQGAGGGGFYGDGSSVKSGNTTWASGGQSYTSGGAGGSGGKTQDTAGTPNNGGFGGGGQGNSYGSGGGGGYSGGAGGPQVASEGDNPSFGGGGGSYLASDALRPTMTLGNTGNGQIVISTLSDLIVGDNASNQSTNFTSGTNAYNSIFVGSAPGDTNNSITVTSSGTVLYSYNNIIVGENGSANDLSVSGGGRVNSRAAGVIGLNATASNNSALVTGTGSTWSNGTSLTIGQSGSSNSLAIQEGGLVTAGGAGVALGYNAGSSGNSLLVDGAGSTLANSSDFVVGFSGSSNAVVVSGGGILTNEQHSYGGIIGLNSGASNNSVLVTGSGSAWHNGGDLLVGWGDSGNTLTVSNGGAVTSSQINYGGAIGFNAGSSNNSVLLTGNGSSWSNSGDLLVGVSGSGNSMVITNGGTVANGQVNYGGVIGLNTSASNNNVLVVGTGSSWSNSGNLTIGWNGASNSMAVMSGGQVVSSQGIVGDVSSNNSAVVTGSGSTWSNSGDLIIGASGLSNTMVISNGATVANGQVNYGGVIGLNAGANNNSVLVTGTGSSWNNSTNLTIGYDGSGNSMVVAGGASVVSGIVNVEGVLLNTGGSGVIGFNAGSANNSALVTGSGSRWIGSGDLFVGFNGAGNSMVVSNSGSVSNAQVNFGGVIGWGASSSNNSALVTGNGSTWNNSGDLTLGMSGSGNTLTVSDGATVVNGQVTNGGVIGFSASSSNNSALVTGNGSAWNNGGNLTVGYDGSGNSLVIEAGASVTTAGYNAPGGGVPVGGILGYNAGSSGNSVLVTGSGSGWSNDWNVIVGYHGSSNSLVVSNGGQVSAEYSSIGRNAGSSNNSVLVTGTGSTWSNRSNLTIGDAGEGTLTIANGGSVSARSITIASQVGSTGTLNFGSLGGSDTAGSLIGPGISFGSGSGTINFNQVDSLIGSGFSGNGSLNQLGTGTTILTGTNTYSGTTTINSGTLVVQGQSSLGTSSVTVNGGTLAASGVFTEFPLALNAGNMTLTGAGSSWNTGTNPLSVGNSSQGASVVVEGGASVVSEGLLALGMNTGASNNSVLVTGSNSSWSTSVANNSSWTVLVGDYGSGNSLEVVDGGQVSAPWFYIGRTAGSSNNSVLVTGSGSTLSNTEFIMIGNSGSGNSLVISDGGRVSSSGAWIGLNAGSSNNSVLVTGSGSSLSNNSIYGTSIGNAGEGTLTVANGGVAASTVGGIWVALDSGSVGTLNIGGFGTNDAAGAINAPKITFGAGRGTINFNQSNATTISAVISGNGTVNQLGSGTTILTGNNNAYNGTTTVNAGTLLANNTEGSAVGSSAVTVNSGGTLGGNGTIGGATTIASGGNLTPGSSGAGVLSFSAGLTLEIGSTTTFLINAPGDFTSINILGNNINFGGELIFNIASYTPTVGDAFTLFNMTGGATQSGGFSSVTAGSLSFTESEGIWSASYGDYAYQFSQSTGQLSVEASQAIPEPSTYALLGLGALALLIAYRRKSRKVV